MAYILSLVLAAMIFVPAIGYIGISEIGEAALGGEGTITHATNATFWNTYASLGSLPLFIVMLSIGGLCLLGIIVLLSKSGVC